MKETLSASLSPGAKFSQAQFRTGVEFLIEVLAQPGADEDSPVDSKSRTPIEVFVLCFFKMMAAAGLPNVVL